MISTVFCTPSLIVLIISPISVVEAEVLSASFFTSSATTANPLPCSPARAASIAALRARRLVWSAISLIAMTMSPIFSDCVPRSCTNPSAVSTVSAMTLTSFIALSTTSCPPFATFTASLAEPATSVELLAISSVAWFISVEPAATCVALSTCSLAPLESFSADMVSCVLAEATSAADDATSLSIRPRLELIASMDFAKTPISSFLLRAWEETGTEKSPLAMRSMWAAERVMGTVMLKVMVRENHTPNAKARTPSTTKTVRAVTRSFLACSNLCCICSSSYVTSLSAASM